MAGMDLPDTIYVRVERAAPIAGTLKAGRAQTDLVGQFERVQIGEYKLVKKQTVELAINVVEGEE